MTTEFLNLVESAAQLPLPSGRTRSDLTPKVLSGCNRVTFGSAHFCNEAEWDDLSHTFDVIVQHVVARLGPFESSMQRTTSDDFFAAPINFPPQSESIDAMGLPVAFRGLCWERLCWWGQNGLVCYVALELCDNTRILVLTAGELSADEVERTDVLVD